MGDPYKKDGRILRCLCSFGNYIVCFSTCFLERFVGNNAPIVGFKVSGVKTQGKYSLVSCKLLRTM